MYRLTTLLVALAFAITTLLPAYADESPPVPRTKSAPQRTRVKASTPRSTTTRPAAATPAPVVSCPACPTPVLSCPPAQTTTLTPEQRAQLLMHAQEMLLMAQNTAICTPTNVIVMQGNRLLVYGPDLALQRTVDLPVPAMTPTAAATTPDTTTTTTTAMAPLSGMVSPRLILSDTGLIILRGNQLLRLDTNYAVVSQATLPPLPPMSAAEIAATCPQCSQLQMAMSMEMMPMTATTMGTTTTPAL